MAIRFAGLLLPETPLRQALRSENRLYNTLTEAETSLKITRRQQRQLLLQLIQDASSRRARHLAPFQVALKRI